MWLLSQDSNTEMMWASVSKEKVVTEKGCGTRGQQQTLDIVPAAEPGTLNPMPPAHVTSRLGLCLDMSLCSTIWWWCQLGQGACFLQVSILVCNIKTILDSFHRIIFRSKGIYEWTKHLAQCSSSSESLMKAGYCSSHHRHLILHTSSFLSLISFSLSLISFSGGKGI